MGLRHQIYLKVPYKFDQFKDLNQNTRIKSDIIALHDQWLTDFSATRKLIQFIKFYKNGIKRDEGEYFIFAENAKYGGYNPGIHSYPEETFRTLYSIDFEKSEIGYLHIQPNTNILNPFNCDNNSGITVIDVTNPNVIKYCFMFLEKREYRQHRTPLSVEEYLKGFYNKETYDDNTDYWTKERIEKTEKEIEDIIREFENIENVEVLTIPEFRNVFNML